MKSKKISKKLALNKKTIATLDNIEKNNLRGGLKWECSDECNTVIEPSGCDYNSGTFCLCITHTSMYPEFCC